MHSLIPRLFRIKHQLTLPELVSQSSTVTTHEMHLGQGKIDLNAVIAIFARKHSRRMALKDLFRDSIADNPKIFVRSLN